MLKLVATVAILAAALLLSGCLMVAPSPVYGILVTSDVGGPHPWVGWFDNNVGATNKGEAEAQGILGFAFGDASIQAAMDNGGITKIHHVDHKAFNVLGVYAKSTTIVYGE